MELEKKREQAETPFEDLAERVGEHRDDLDDVWEAFAERAGENGQSDVEEPAEAEAETEWDSADGDTREPPDGIAGVIETDEKEDPDATENESIEGSAQEDGPMSASEPDTALEADPLEELIDPEDDRLDPRDAERVRANGKEYVVPKDSYCEQCPYFGEPPDVGCTNDGTEIVEFEDMEHVRVRNCPKVDQGRVAPDDG